MDTPLSSTVVIRSQDGLWADFEMVNQNEHPVKVVQPGNFEPTAGWAYSYDAYQVASLQSFDFLNMKVIDQDGKEIRQNTIITLANHVFRQIDLIKGSVLKLDIPLHEFYNLDKGIPYTLIIQYGRDERVAYVNTRFKID